MEQNKESRELLSLKSFILCMLTGLGFGKYSVYTKLHAAKLNEITQNYFHFKETELSESHAVIKATTEGEIEFYFALNSNGVVTDIILR